MLLRKKKGTQRMGIQKKDVLLFPMLLWVSLLFHAKKPAKLV